jgi:hypothetical protein
MPRNYPVVLTKLIPIILYLLFACSSDDDAPNPVPAPTSCLLRQVAFDGGSCTITRNDKGLPVRLDFVYSNSANNRFTIIEYDASDNVVKLYDDNTYVEYKYNTSNKVISGGVFRRINATEPYGTYLSMEYTYNAQGYMDSVIYAENRYERFEYDANGVIVKSYGRTDYKPEALMTEYLEFDDKKNPRFEDYFYRYTIVANPVVMISGLKLPFTGDHNLVSKNVLLLDGTMANYTTDFEYNELGYPTTSTLTISKPVQSYTSHFHYDCK